MVTLTERRRYVRNVLLLFLIEDRYMRRFLALWKIQELFLSSVILEWLSGELLGEGPIKEGILKWDLRFRFEY